MKTQKPTAAASETRSPEFREISQLSEHRSFVLYGRSGTGKTTLASTFPQPALIVDIKDVGTDSISDVAEMKALDAKSWDDIELVYWYLKANPGKFKTVILDTVSQLQQLAIEKVLKRKKKALKGTKNAGDWGTMAMRDWGEVASLMKTWIINFRDLPMTVVFIAQERAFNVGEEDSEVMLDPEVGPALTPSVAKHLNAAVHVIGNTFIRTKTVTVEKPGKKAREEERIQYCLRIGPNPMYITKVRKPKSVKPPSVIINPKYQDIVDIIKGAK